MAILLPTSLDDACRAAADHPDATLLAGGTDLMVEVNAGHRRPTAVIALSGVDELRRFTITDDEITIGAGVTFTTIAEGELGAALPALAQAARTVGSPQIRNAATLGGNLGTGSPAGDSLPVLAALEAHVQLRSIAGLREVPIDAFFVGPKRTDRRTGEVIVGVRLRRPDGPQEFCKLGTRQAMVISVASVAVVSDRSDRSVRVGLGAVGPTPLRAPEAESFAAEAIDWSGGRGVDASVIGRFAELVTAAARPITDHRSTRDYRLHAVGVMAGRALRRMFP